MNSKAIRYRDTFAAPGSQLFEALQTNDTKRAERIYNECEREYLRFNKCTKHNRFCWVCTSEAEQ